MPAPGFSSGLACCWEFTKALEGQALFPRNLFRGVGWGGGIIWGAMVGRYAPMKKIPVWKLSLLKDSFSYD